MFLTQDFITTTIETTGAFSVRSYGRLKGTETLHVRGSESVKTTYDGEKLSIELLTFGLCVLYVVCTCSVFCTRCQLQYDGVLDLLVLRIRTRTIIIPLELYTHV